MKRPRVLALVTAILLLTTLAIPTFATETTPETTPTETITQVIEVVEVIDYSTTLEQISTSVQAIEDATLLLSAFALFAVVVCLCYFCYKFLRIFF